MDVRFMATDWVSIWDTETVSLTGNTSAEFTIHPGALAIAVNYAKGLETNFAIDEVEVYVGGSWLDFYIDDQSAAVTVMSVKTANFTAVYTPRVNHNLGNSFLELAGRKARLKGIATGGSATGTISALVSFIPAYA